jgi:multiple sugar transport system substrate-binding protein
MRTPTACAVALAALVLTSCSTAPGNAGRDGTTVITFAHWGTNAENATLSAMVTAFEEAHPEIDVQSTWIQSDYEQKLQTAIAGGEAPTVSQISNTSLAAFASTYRPVTLDAGAYYSSDVPASMLIGGTAYALPFAAKTKVMAVNTAVFDRAGVAPPPSDRPLTPQQYADLAHRVTSGSGPDEVYGSAPLRFQGWLTTNGGTLYSADGKRCTMGSPVGVQAAQQIIAAQGPGGYAPSPLDAQGQDLLDWLSIGRIAMQPDVGPWDIAGLVALHDPALVLVPDPGEGEPMEVNGLGVSTTATAEQLTAAEEFTTFMSTDPRAQDLLTTREASLGVPVVEPSVKAFLAVAPELDLSLFVRAVEQAGTTPSVEPDVEIRTALNDALVARTALGSGTEDPATVLPELQQQCQRTLSAAS